MRTTSPGRLFALALLLGALAAHATPPPAGMAFVGLQDGAWRLFVVRADGAPKAVATQPEPRTPALSRDGQRVAYVSASGELREVDLRSGADAVLLRPDAEAAYTQPAYGPSADALYVVVLKRGSSVDTDIATVDRQAGRARPVVTQRSAQFEPHVSADGRVLLYGHVACTLECGKIIQEVWARDLLTGEAEQLTLLNGISRQASHAPDGAVVFSSNGAGPYNIWRLPRRGARPEQLTEGTVTDETPVADAAGNVFFVRRQREGSALMRRAPDGRLTQVSLPRNVTDIKDLRFSR